MQTQTAQILTASEMARLAPAIFATQKHESRKEHYGFVNTADILESLAKDGWQPSYVGVKRARTEKSRFYGSHTLRLRHVDAKPIEALQGVMEIVLRNGHDGSSAIVGNAGVFRFVCANGLVCGTTIAGFRVFHHRNAIDDVRNAIARMRDDLPRLVGTVDAWRSTQLQAEEQQLLAEGAARLRWSETATPVQAQQLLTARRMEDASNDLWTTFNRIQENVIQGGLRGRTATNRRMTTRRVGSGMVENKLNRELWALAEGMAKLKGVAA